MKWLFPHPVFSMTRIMLLAVIFMGVSSPGALVLCNFKLDSVSQKHLLEGKTWGPFSKRFCPLKELITFRSTLVSLWK
jgi:hypothetical protein